MKDILKWAMIPLAVLLYIANDRMKPGPADAAPTVAVDQVAVKLGQDYRAALGGAGQSMLDSVANSAAGTTADLSRAQRDVLNEQLKSAWSPVATELEKRFGQAGTSGPEAVRGFYRDLASGYRKGGK